jgi:N-acetylglutamate synthase-like GNAT family acetyltransferase
MPIAIEPFSPRHADGVVSVILPIQREEFGIPITLAKQPDLLDIPRYYQKDGGNFWVALDEGRVIGTIALLDIGDRRGALRKMFVNKTHRGSRAGVASGLLAVLLAWSETHAFSEIYLGTTPQFLAAHRFYEKNGFVEVPKADLPPSFPLMIVDTKFYKRAFHPRELDATATVPS